MDEYQSIELHRWASHTYYASYYDSSPTDNNPPIIVGQEFNGSAFSGGQIAFIDNEDISLYEDKLKAKYAPPVDIDRKYLPMILNTKKLKVSLDVVAQFNGGLNPCTVSGKLEGSFDSCDVFVRSRYDNSYYDEGEYDYPLEGAAWSRRDISSKAAQLNPNADTVSYFQTSPVGDNQQLEVITMSRRDFEQKYSSSWDLIVAGISSEPDVRPLMFPKATVSASHDSWAYVPNPETGIYEDRSAQLDNYSKSNSNELSGNYTFNMSITSEYYAQIFLRCSIGFVVVTPTKVHAFPNVYGILLGDDEAAGVGLTSVKADTYPANDYGEATDFAYLPSYASSPIMFFGKSIPIYFYERQVYDGVPINTYSGLSLAGTSFDISVEEEY